MWGSEPGRGTDLYIPNVARLVGITVFFSSRRRHTSYWRDWSSDVCSSDLRDQQRGAGGGTQLVRGRVGGDRYPGEELERGRCRYRQPPVRRGDGTGADRDRRDDRSEERRVGEGWRDGWRRCR